ncbi:zinc finger and BTB domain-containing protein 49 isoform X2 [Gouania willdenowi]|nr:zinc finger and BTB domain-containing protein 49 isoform X2 [Gouania willdenowi]
MYTSHLDINQDNVQALLDIAQCLQVPNVQSMCNAFLKPSCLPPVEISSFSIPGMLGSDHDCLIGSSIPPDVDLHCPSESHRHGFNSELDGSRKTSNADVSFNSQTPVEKQLVHGYKLRNFYSKQYFKQSALLQTNSAGPGPLVLMEEQQYQGGGGDPPTLTSPSKPCTSSMVVDNKNPVSSLTPSDHLNSFTSDTVDDSALNQLVQPKKAVYLKKYNYLRSQKALEEMCAKSTAPAPGPVLARPEEIHQPEPESLLQPRAPEAAQINVAVGTTEEAHEEAAAAVEDDLRLPLPLPPSENQEELLLHVKPAVEQVQLSGNKQCCCDVCGKIFKHRSNLELHRRSHTGEKPFQCNICAKSFSQAGNLQTHLRRHSGEKPYICELCGKSFTASGDVQRHKLVHTGEKPHLCDICGRGFNNSSNLKEHKRSHATDKNFTCDQCGKSFNTHRKLLKHKGFHAVERPHSCATCGRSFMGSGDLQRHMRSHTGEKPYMCHTCGKSFTRSALLRRHSNMYCKGPPVEKPDAVPSKHTLKRPLNKDVPHVENHTPLATPLPELHSLVPHHLLSPTHQEGNGAADASADVLKQSKGALTQQKNGSSSLDKATGSSRAYRATEGPFTSSVTLWGLAMKTLQNENDMEQ